MNESNLIMYKTADGQANIALYARDGNVWLSQAQIAELFATSVPNMSMHASNILEEKELDEISVVKDFLTTAADGKQYNVRHYSLSMVSTSGSRCKSGKRRGAPFYVARCSAPCLFSRLVEQQK